MNDKNKKHLVVVGHPDHESFCYNGIFKTIINELENGGETFKVIDVYEDKLHRNKEELIKEYQSLVRGQHTFILYHLFGGLEWYLKWKPFLMRYLHRGLPINLYRYLVCMLIQNHFLVIRK